MPLRKEGAPGRGQGLEIGKPGQGEDRALTGGVKLSWGQNSFTHASTCGRLRWPCTRRKGPAGEALKDEAAVQLLQLLLGQHQPVSLSEASRTREGHFAQVDSVVLLLLLGLRVGEQRPPHQGLLSCVPRAGPEPRDPGRPWETGLGAPGLR